MGEQKDEAGSTWNEGEALVVREHLRRLLEAGLQQIQLAVITPYNAQVRKQLCMYVYIDDRKTGAAPRACFMFCGFVVTAVQ